MIVVCGNLKPATKTFKAFANHPAPCATRLFSRFNTVKFVFTNNKSPKKCDPASAIWLFGIAKDVRLVFFIKQSAKIRAIKPKYENMNALATIY